MFPRLRERFGTALDILVEFSTLGEYRLDAQGAPAAASAQPAASGHGPGLGGVGSPAGEAPVRRTVAGGATGLTRGVPPEGVTPSAVATPAARRLSGRGEHAVPRSARPPGRPGSPVAPEQPCLSAGAAR